MSSRRHLLAFALGGFSAAAGLTGLGSAMAAPQPITLLNVSYDPTRELYKAINVSFAALTMNQDRTTGPSTTVRWATLLSGPTT